MQREKLAQLIEEVNRKQLWNMTYSHIYKFIVIQEDKVTIFTWNDSSQESASINHFPLDFKLTITNNILCVISMIQFEK